MAEPKGPPPRVDWRCADLRGANMAGMSLRNADLRAANLAGCNFTGSDLAYADFRGANVQGPVFQNASLYGAKMQGVAAQQADFRGADLRQCNLGGAYMEGAMFPKPERKQWPSEIAKANRHRQPEQQGKGNGQEKANGRDTGHSM
jgi:hypothetical protein